MTNHVQKATLVTWLISPARQIESKDQGAPTLTSKVYLKCETQLKDQLTRDVLTYSNSGLPKVLTYPKSNH